MSLQKKCRWVAIFACLVAFLALPSNAEAQRRRGGGGYRSKPKPTRTSRPKSPSRTQGGRSAQRTNTTRKDSSKVVKSKADRAAYENAKKSGKAFSSRQDAMKDFKTKNAQKYTSKYAQEPAKRPEHIPATYKGQNGNTYNIVYNQTGGGYGYWNGGGPGLGTFMLYDALSDMAMMSYFNGQMRTAGYYYGPPPATSAGGVIIIVIALIVGCVVVVLVIKGLLGESA